MSRPKRLASCHSQRPHYAKGLCRYCYTRSAQHRRKFAQYGITPAQLKGFQERANGSCPLCRIPSNRLTAWRIHKKGRVVGVVCWFCRKALWQIGTIGWRPGFGPDWLRRAARLMERSLNRQVQLQPDDDL